MTVYHNLKHPRKVSAIVDEKIAGYGSSDGGTVWGPIKTDTDGRLLLTGGLIPGIYDYASESYTGPLLTQAVCRMGGSGGDIVATLDFGYTLGKLTSITRS